MIARAFVVAMGIAAIAVSGPSWPQQPPPRTISDITALLNQYKPDPRRIQELKNVADAQPYAGADLAGFYRRRANAARALGRAEQQVADLKQALKQAREQPISDEPQILMDLGIAYVLTGNMADAIEVRQRALRGLVGAQKGRMLTWSSYLSINLSAFGEFDQASRHLATSRRLLGDARSWSPWDNWGEGWDVWGEHWQWAVFRAEGVWLDYQGRHGEAEPFLRRALLHFERWMSKLSKPGFMQAVRGGKVYTDWNYEQTIAELARCLASQGRLSEAESEARRALELALSRSGSYTAETPVMLRSLAVTLYEQGRAAEADRIVGAVLRIYDVLGMPADAWSRLRMRALRFGILFLQERWETAVAEAEAIRHAARGSGVFERVTMHDAAWPWALAKAGRVDEALAVARELKARFAESLGTRHERTAAAGAALGHALSESGRLDEALQAFREAIPTLIAGMAQREELARSGRALHDLRMALEAYLDLLAKLRVGDGNTSAGIDIADEAFRIAEYLRSGSVQRAIAASSVRAAVGDPALAEIARREQDARQQILALKELLVEKISLPPSQRSEKLEAFLRSRIQELEQIAVSLDRDIRLKFPRYAELMSPSAPSVAQTRSRLGPDECLIAIHSTANRTFVWAIPHDGNAVFAVLPITRAELTRSVRLLRRGLDTGATSPDRVPLFNLAVAHRLYQQVMEPVAEGWKDAKSLLIVTSGALSELPFSVLPTAHHAFTESDVRFGEYRSVPWLIRRSAVSHLPTVGALVALRGASPVTQPTRNFVGFGDPVFSKVQLETATGSALGPIVLRSAGITRLDSRGRPVHSAQLADLPPLPDTAEEIMEIAKVLGAEPGRDVFLGRDANEQNVITRDLSNARIVAFATHGLVPGDLNGLMQPALALTHPEVSGIEGDGLLTLDEILGIKLNAEWVILSACNTAAAEGAGAEAVSGLGRAFFYAGARALLVSNWPVETVSARLLTTDIFRRQSTDSTLARAEALQRTMLDLLDRGGAKDASGKVLFSYAHPMFWAPFSLVGDGGR